MTIFCPYNQVNKRATDLGFLLALENEGPSTKGAKNRYFQMARYHLHNLGSTNKNLTQNNLFLFSQNASTVFLLLCHLQKKCLWAKQKRNTSLLMKLNKKRLQ